MKRYIAFGLSLLMLLTCIIPVSASSSSMLIVGNVEGGAGEKVIVPIELDTNPGFVSMSLSVTYDTSALTLISCEYTEVISGSVHSANYISPYVLTWENDTLTSNITSTGTIAYLTFLVSEDADEGDYAIIARIPTDGVLDANGNNVSVSAAQGTIIVSEAHICSFGDWEYYSKTKHVRYCDGDDCDEKEYKNHNWNDGEIIKEPTHDEEGEIEYTCEDCDYSYTTEIDPKEHSWDSGVVTKQPTETEAGIRTYTCDDCGATKTETIPPIEGDELPVTGITLSETNVALNVGDTKLVAVDVQPEDATDRSVIWSISDPSVIEIHESVQKKYINIIALSEGTATITATTVDGGFVATCVVTVGGDEEKTIVGYKWYTGVLRHKVMYSDGTYKMEDCAPSDCICGRQYDPLPDESANIIISTREVCPGQTVTVDVKISDNPGLSSLVLKLSYDQSLLTLTNVAYNTAMGGQTVPPSSLASPVTLYWVNGFADYTGNDVFATLTFTVSENAGEGDTTDITVTYNSDDVFNIDNKNVGLDITFGKITVINYIPGDINGDGILNNKDVTRFMQYNADWDVEVNALALDVDGDGSVNNKDVTRLMQYHAGWDVEIH